MVADTLIHMNVGSLSHTEEAKKDLVKDFHRLAKLGVRLEDSPNGGFMVHHYYESSLVVKVMSKQNLDISLIELKELVLFNLDEAFSLGGGVLRYQGRLVDELRNRIHEEAHGSSFSIHLRSTKMYHDHREVYWW